MKVIFGVDIDEVEAAVGQRVEPIVQRVEWQRFVLAQLRPGVLEVIDEVRQRGNLLHRVTERLFGDGVAIN